MLHGSGSGSAGAMRATHEAPEGSGRIFERQRMEIRKKAASQNDRRLTKTDIGGETIKEGGQGLKKANTAPRPSPIAKTGKERKHNRIAK